MLTSCTEFHSYPFRDLRNKHVRKFMHSVTILWYVHVHMFNMNLWMLSYKQCKYVLMKMMTFNLSEWCPWQQSCLESMTSGLEWCLASVWLGILTCGFKATSTYRNDCGSSWKVPMILVQFQPKLVSWQMFVKHLNIKFHKNLVSSSQTVTCR